MPTGPSGGAAPGVGDRLPRPPQRRQWGMASLAVVLIVGGAAVAGLLAVRLDDRRQVLVARVHLSAGEQITQDDLATVAVASDGLATIPADHTSLVVGRYAAQDIPSGRLLDGAMITSSGALRAGRAAVGVSLAAGRMPASGLQAGDVVMIVTVKDSTPTVLSQNAVVSSVRSADGGSFSATSNGSTATLVVDTADAAAVAAASIADELAVVLISRGGQG